MRINANEATPNQAANLETNDLCMVTMRFVGNLTQMTDVQLREFTARLTKFRSTGKGCSKSPLPCATFAHATARGETAGIPTAASASGRSELHSHPWIAAGSPALLSDVLNSSPLLSPCGFSSSPSA